RRIPLDGMPARPGRKTLCRAGRLRPIWKDDLRVKYCAQCLERGNVQAWRQQQKQLYGPYALQIQSHVRHKGGVKRLRTQFALTQRELANRSGLSLPSVKCIEQGRLPCTKNSRNR